MKVVSLFSGCGGMDLGFIKAGHQLVWVNDNDSDSLETYKDYFCKKLGMDTNHVCLENIEKVKTDNIPDCDVVIGGFPCQGFSMANPYRHTEDNRNKLYIELLRVIKEKKPKYFIAENVPGICSIGGYETKEDKKNHEGRIFKMILNELRNANEMGYYVKFKILNAADFGVPQTRRRVIILGTRKDIEPKLMHPEPTHDKNSSKKNHQWKTVKDALIGIPEKPDEKIPNHLGTSHKVTINGYLGNRPTNPNKPSPTIAGRGGGTGGPVIIPHPNLKRRMTVRETARIQCFPDDFIFKGSISSQYRQIGNAVPWPLAYNIALMLPYE